nr:MarR family transcriptional regulator [Propionibacterium sp.]
MSGAGPSREEWVAAITEDARLIGWLSERIGHGFAQAQRLHSTDFRALNAIYRACRDGEPLTSKALAAELQLSPAAITYVVGRLVEAGHVRRDEDPTDRRRVILEVDDPGREVARSFFGPLGAAHTEALRSFDASELATAHRVLRAVIGVLDVFESEVRRGHAPEGEEGIADPAPDR